MQKEHIIAEIKRTAEQNEGKPLGRSRFQRETGIKESDWYGKHWTKWSDALREAGYQPNTMQGSYDGAYLIGLIVSLIKKLGRFPTRGDLRMEYHSRDDFPTDSTLFRRLGQKASVARKVIDYCENQPGLSSVIRICQPIANSEPVEPPSSTAEAPQKFAYVYLIRSGKFYKIGKTDSIERRTYELKIQLPEKPRLIHHIKTDDAVGIEAYWHNRFRQRHKNGEWFELSAEDVNAFRRRKFM